MASGSTEEKSPRHPNIVREDHKVFSGKYSTKILDNAHSGDAQIKKDNATMKEANTVSWLAASHAYQAGESGKHRTSRLRAIFDRVDDVGLKQRESSIDARTRQQQRGGQVSADETHSAFEGIGAWSAHKKN